MLKVSNPSLPIKNHLDIFLEYYLACKLFIPALKCWANRYGKKALRKLRERKRKLDVIYKTAKVIEQIASQNNAVVAIGNVRKGKRRLAKETKRNTLRHRIHQWSVSTLVKVLSNKPLHIEEVPEAYTSSTDPFSDKYIHSFTPSMIRFAVRKKRVKALLRWEPHGVGLDRAP